MKIHLSLCIVLTFGVYAESAQERKDASSFTQDANNNVYKELPFSDKQSFTDAQKGFIAPLPTKMIKTEKGADVWNPEKFDFVNGEKKSPDSVNPSLWRQSKLINTSGLFKVSDRIYQVRNYDLSNMTIIEGNTGVIVIDPLISEETAKAALDLYFENRPKKPVVAVIYSHSHVDHYGGVRGVTDEKDVKSGKVKIIAPVGFLEHSVSENVMAGNAMSRRASYMYGNLLPPDEKGNVGTGLGTTTSTGTITLIPPTDIISKAGQKMNIDGLNFTFLYTPDTEAPSEMHWFIDELKALSTAENSTHTMHNTYSLRGAKIRDPLAWSKSLNETLQLWGDKAEVLYGMHHWPVWGKDNVVNHLEKQRDMYRFINDQTLRLANQGYTMVELAEMIKLPKSLHDYWSNRGYYGSLNHNVKATYVLYLGWFDGNPATLHPLPPADASKRYVEYMGGSEELLTKAKKAFADGDYRWVAQVVNHAVFADPSNQEARNLQADALEQLGYQAESGPWRNFYLTGAQELRDGVVKASSTDTASADTIRVMDLDLFFDYLAIKVNAQKAEGKTVTLNLVFPDIDEKYVLSLENSVLNHTPSTQSDEADATITLNRSDLNDIILKTKTLDESIKSGRVKIEGEQGKLNELLSMLDSFNLWFDIVTPNPKS